MSMKSMLGSVLQEGLPLAVYQKRLIKDAPMASYTTFRVGGPADYLLDLHSEEELLTALRLAHSVIAPVTIIGKGSNLLVRSGGIRGLVIRIGKNMEDIQISDDTIDAQCGCSLSRLAGAAAKAGLTGLEFASGIPGTLGGGAAMNAGAYNGELAQHIRKVHAYDMQGNLHELDVSRMKYGYRKSIALEKKLILTRCTLRLSQGDEQEIRARMEGFAAARREKQPLNLPSAGSTFKRPTGYFAAKLIDDAGLRGYKIGGAQVSDKHAGFIVNTGGATPEDILSLIEHVKCTVLEKFGVTLACEVRILGEDPKA